MSSQFDEIIDRRHTFCEKYDDNASFGKPDDVIPLWVADMDFRSPAPVRKALKELAERGMFGYSRIDEEYFAPIRRWYESRFGWKPEYEWLTCTPGVVYALSTAILAFTQPGDAVMIQQPVYHPFAHAVETNGRRLVNSPLHEEQGVYRMENAADLERRIVENKVKMFLLCSPHNPVGRVWEEEELLALGQICCKHNVLVVADEIHADFVFSGRRHHVFAALRPEFANNTVTCTAPSKTFNLAGLQTSNIFISNPELRLGFRRQLGLLHYEQPNLAGLVACMTAYREGAPWLEELLAYLQENVALVRTFLRERLPQVRLVEPQGTYLLWVDFSALNLGEQTLDGFLTQQARLWVNPGELFGPSGKGFARVNIGCPRAVLERALQQLEKAVKTLSVI